MSRKEEALTHCDCKCDCDCDCDRNCICNCKCDCDCDCVCDCDSNSLFVVGIAGKIAVKFCLVNEFLITP
jgi:hypothetical protein